MENKDTGLGSNDFKEGMNELMREFGYALDMMGVSYEDDEVEDDDGELEDRESNKLEDNKEG